ncbi:MAG TPA: DUF4465 domain-containing protein [Bacteroidia bacterium]|nr:DUF4465 domain-containing protein [Bacteroidia bacterium]
MKKFKLSILLFVSGFAAQAQLIVSDFETFSLSPNSYYFDTNSVSFSVQNATFRHQCSKFTTWFWTGGFSYTNKYDSSTAGFTNLYGVKPLKGYNNSATYVVGQDRGSICLASIQNTLEGFYITNTTFAYKAIRNGSSFSRKFGDTTGTGSGNSITQGSYPDYFKLSIKGFKNGSMKPDSVEFYLADYRFTNNNLDYVVDTWQWVNTSVLGEIDSLVFIMHSSDVGAFGINTPLFFALDNITTRGLIQGLQAGFPEAELNIYPNPAQDRLFIEYPRETLLNVRLYDIRGKFVLESKPVHQNLSEIDLSALEPGYYELELEGSGFKTFRKIIKN